MHIPVLQKEVLTYLDPKANENFIDCTIGEGGHTIKILEKSGPLGKVLGIDQDQKQIENCKLKIKDFQERTILVCDSYVNLKNIVEKYKFKHVKGILFDLGLSSWHLEESGRGFSFLREEPLDMRYDAKIQNYLTAEEIVNKYPKKEIEQILREYGEERFSRRIAEEVVEQRKIKPIRTTFDLLDILRKAILRRYQRQRIHFATRTFQALRITVNNELNNLKSALPQILEVLEPGGRIVVISFHSLEDRIVKNFLRETAKQGILKILTKKVIKPSFEEIKINNRARSAKLRTAIKI